MLTVPGMKLVHVLYMFLSNVNPPHDVNPATLTHAHVLMPNLPMTSILPATLPLPAGSVAVTICAVTSPHLPFQQHQPGTLLQNCLQFELFALMFLCCLIRFAGKPERPSAG